MIYITFHDSNLTLVGGGIELIMTFTLASQAIQPAKFASSHVTKPNVWYLVRLYLVSEPISFITSAPNSDSYTLLSLKLS